LKDLIDEQTHFLVERGLKNRDLGQLRTAKNRRSRLNCFQGLTKLERRVVVAGLRKCPFSTT
jgi:hypothetical protein